MAKSKTNILTHGFSGKVGDQFVIKNYSGISVIARKPTFTKPWSEKQIANRRRFARAARSAAILARQPETSEKYADKLKPRQSITNLIISEKLNGETI